ncbi:MAG: hypothetical protein CMJ58_25835 [Planctomycetaceae bacterium]|nr:hypothetical protein [Planctomycetaceae bacterium]
MVYNDECQLTDYGLQYLIALQTVESVLHADESLAARARGDLQYVVNEILADSSEELRKDVIVYLSCTVRYSG